MDEIEKRDAKIAKLEAALRFTWKVLKYRMGAHGADCAIYPHAKYDRFSEKPTYTNVGPCNCGINEAVELTNKALNE